MPVGNVLVGDAGSDVEHDDATLPVDVVPITKTTELFLPGRIPHVKLDGAKVLRRKSVNVRAPRRHRVWTAPTVVKPRGWTSTPRVAMYFFSNSPVKCLLTKVVCRAGIKLASFQPGGGGEDKGDKPPDGSWECSAPAGKQPTFPVPPSPTRTSLKVGVCC